MAETKTPAMDVQAALAAVLAGMEAFCEECRVIREESKASMQAMREENESFTDDTMNGYEALREDNEKIYNAVLDQAESKTPAMDIQAMLAAIMAKMQPVQEAHAVSYTHLDVYKRQVLVQEIN